MQKRSVWASIINLSLGILTLGYAVYARVHHLPLGPVSIGVVNSTTYLADAKNIN